jgi:hypothetical protein
MHVMTKELPDWTWGTFWWDDRPDEGPFARYRPAGVAGVWRNYLMNSTFSQVTPRESDDVPNICFNPYLEGKLDGGPQSNCVRCHRMAARPDLMMKPIPTRPVSAADLVFKRDLKTDYVWSASIEQDALLKKLQYLQVP